MTSITNRIDLGDAKKKFDELRLNQKIKLPNDLMDSINTIINNNKNMKIEAYVDELSDIRLVKNGLSLIVYHGCTVQRHFACDKHSLKSHQNMSWI